MQTDMNFLLFFKNIFITLNSNLHTYMVYINQTQVALVNIYSTINNINWKQVPVVRLIWWIQFLHCHCSLGWCWFRVFYPATFDVCFACFLIPKNILNLVSLVRLKILFSVINNYMQYKILLSLYLNTKHVLDQH